MKKKLTLSNSIGETLILYTTENKELLLIDFVRNEKTITVQFNYSELGVLIEELQVLQDELTVTKKK